MKFREPTPEERELGLEPSKYTQKQWNPSDFIGWAQANGQPAKEAVEVAKPVVNQEEMSPFILAALDSEMNKVKSIQGITPDQMDVKREMLKRLLSK